LEAPVLLIKASSERLKNLIKPFSNYD
jgi:hypothetical protein